MRSFLKDNSITLVPGRNPLRITAAIFIMFIVSACGSFQLSLEQSVEVPTQGSDSILETPTAVTETIQDDPIGLDGAGPFYIGEPFSLGTEEGKTVLMVRDGVAAFAQSPVDVGVLWDYSGPSGKIAYASEFYHASRDFSRSVTDLWVYDFATGMSERWLEDDVSQAFWSPYLPDSTSPQKLVAAVFDSTSGTYDLHLVEGPSQTQMLAQCASEEFGFSPDGNQVVYKAGWYQDENSRPEDCDGVFIVDLEDLSLRRLTETNPVATGGWFRDQPLWSESLNALLFKSYNESSIFNLVPLDGSGWFEVSNGEQIDVEYLPTPFLSLWSDQYQSVIGQTEGMMDPFAVWVYRFSVDGTEIEEAFRVDWGEFPHDLILLGWWEPGESVMIRDITNPSNLNPLGEVVVWSLRDRSVVETISSPQEYSMTLYPADVKTGIPGLDDVLEAFLRGDASQRAMFAQTTQEACTEQIFTIGPPPCEEGMEPGTIVERFPYRRFRDQLYVKPDEIIGLMDFPIDGLYAIAHFPPPGTENQDPPTGIFHVALVSEADQKLINLVVDLGNVVEIDFWELTPPEVYSGYRGNYVLPPL